MAGNDAVAVAVAAAAEDSQSLFFVNKKCRHIRFIAADAAAVSGKWGERERERERERAIDREADTRTSFAGDLGRLLSYPPEDVAAVVVTAAAAAVVVIMRHKLSVGRPVRSLSPSLSSPSTQIRFSGHFSLSLSLPPSPQLSLLSTQQQEIWRCVWLLWLSSLSVV